MNEDQIKHMAEQFLRWKLPENFNPDGGISFKRDFNENTPFPMKHEPSGTNLLDYTQAVAMVRHMVEGMNFGSSKVHDDVICALVECEDYFDNRADADCDQDGFIPNEEMKLLDAVRTALKKAGA